MFRYIISVFAGLLPCAVLAQPCDMLIVSNAPKEYCQKERSIGRTFFGKPVTAEMWIDKIGEYVYFNILLKDSASGSILNKSYGDNNIGFAFYGGKSISYSYIDSAMKSVISIPLNKPPERIVKIVEKISDSSSILSDYRPFLDAFYLDTLIYVSFSKLDRQYSVEPVRFSEFLYFNLKKTEAIKLRESVFCIFKAIQ